MPRALYDRRVSYMPAAQPSLDRCTRTIFGGMINACSQPGGGVYPASVNLMVLPTALGNGLPVDGGKSYPSYYLASNVTGVNPVVPAT